MNIDTLKIRNFLTIGDEVELTLANQGLVLIEGVNEEDSSADSNGAGKSSVCDALCWALWGVTARGESGDAVVNNVRKKDCAVSVTLSDEKNEWEITRHRKHKEHKNATIVQHRDVSGFAPGAWKDITLATERDTQAMIARILGSTYEIFKASIYSAQEDAVDLPAKTDRELKALIEEAAGVQRIERAHKVANAKLSDAKGERSMLTVRAETLEHNLAGAEERIVRLKEDDARWVEAQAEHKEALKKEAGELKSVLMAAGAEIKKVDATALKARLAEINASMGTYDAAVKAVEESGAALHEMERTVERLSANAKREKDEATACVTKVKTAHEAVSGSCAECGKPHTEDDVNNYKAVWSARARAAVERYNQAVADLTAASAERDSRATAHDFAKSGVPDVTALTDERAKIETALREYAVLVNSFKLQKGKLDTLAAQIAATEASPYVGALARERETLKETRETLKTLEAKAEELDAALEVLRAACEVLGPAGVRAHILDTVTPFLNDRTNEYLSILSDGNIEAVWSTLGKTAKGELREKFNIAVAKRVGGQSFKLLSGGEKRKVRLATMLAMQDLVASRATKPIGLWVGDEVDQALDAAGLERLMMVLEKRARERGTVLIISHNDLKNWCDNVTTVTKGADGLSTVTGVLAA